LIRPGVIAAILRPALLALWEVLPHGINRVADGLQGRCSYIRISEKRAHLAA
jgi:hypothetical protein